MCVVPCVSVRVCVPCGGCRRYEGYLTSIAPTDPEEDEEEGGGPLTVGRSRPITAPADVLKDFEGSGTEDPFAAHKRQRIVDRQDDYHRRQMRHMLISPVRGDPFADGRWLGGGLGVGQEWGREVK